MDGVVSCLMELDFQNHLYNRLFHPAHTTFCDALLHQSRWSFDPTTSHPYWSFDERGYYLILKGRCLIDRAHTLFCVAPSIIKTIRHIKMSGALNNDFTVT
ncbi:hypothetical protein [Rickettsia endosymbiont of Orchestes rusci]|uniref:hypothetical protein n=1 Tax=Rickettsia endosymbiont of Orchestes rusci TaxID=3066250 RepID=UPI00313CF997